MAASRATARSCPRITAMQMFVSSNTLILAMTTPLGRGSPDGFALRHLRLRFAAAHTGARQPFYAALNGASEKLRTLNGDELAAVQAKLKEPLARLELVFKAAESERLGDLTQAMLTASKEFNEALKK